MPRNVGTLYYGQAVEQTGGGPARVTVTIDDTIYTGTWVATAPQRTTGTVAVGVGFGSRHAGVGFGTTPVVVETPAHTESKALLQSEEGKGLRCDFKGVSAGGSGGGTCTDDQGLVYDVQISLQK